MDTLFLLTTGLIQAFPSVRNFRIPFHPSLHTKCGANFVSVVDELSQLLISTGLIERGDMHFDYDFDTCVLTILFPNNNAFLCDYEDDDPDQLTCYLGLPMKPYRSMEEGVSAKLISSIKLLGHVVKHTSVVIHSSCVHSLTLETAGRLTWVEGVRWEKLADSSGEWIVIRTSASTN